jgi:hypothetical protein
MFIICSSGQNSIELSALFLDISNSHLYLFKDALPTALVM